MDARATANPELVLCAIGLYVRTLTDKDVLVILKALRQWITGLRGNRWGAVSAACITAYVCGNNDNNNNASLTNT